MAETTKGTLFLVFDKKEAEHWLTFREAARLLGAGGRIGGVAKDDPDSDEARIITSEERYGLADPSDE